MNTVAFGSLGCKLNQYEVESIAAELDERGYHVVHDGADADIYVLNTCTVTNKSDRKSRHAMYRALGRNEGEAPLVVVTGCFVDSHREELEARGDVLVVDNKRKSQIPDILDAHTRGEFVHPRGLAPDLFGYRPSAQLLRTRHMLKIQDGCDNFCSFCIIPYVRGRAVSRPLSDVLGEARQVLAQGAHELVLTGVNMSRYSFEGLGFSDLIAAILELDGEFRLRISSLEPDQIDEEFFELLHHPKMAPHLHLCLQSASERVLLAMRRQYSYRAYRGIVDRIRRDRPDFNFTTDLLVGFPGETESEFEESLQAISEIGFSHVHTFPYSIRGGTRAERMPGQVSNAEKTRRARLIRERADEAKARYRRSMIGRGQELLIERLGEDGSLSGYGEHYIPIQASADSFEPVPRRGDMVPVRLTELLEDQEQTLRAGPAR